MSMVSKAMVEDLRLFSKDYFKGEKSVQEQRSSRTLKAYKEARKQVPDDYVKPLFSHTAPSC